MDVLNAGKYRFDRFCSKQTKTFKTAVHHVHRIVNSPFQLWVIPAQSDQTWALKMGKNGKKNNSYHFWVFNVTTVLESVLTVSHEKINCGRTVHPKVLIFYILPSLMLFYSQKNFEQNRFFLSAHVWSL